MPRGALQVDAPAGHERDLGLLAAFRTVSGFVTGFAQSELAGPLSQQAGDDATSIIDRITGLPADRFPRLVEMARLAATSTPEAEFHAGLQIILAGLEPDSL